jgi:hypothetical protein
MHRMNDLDLWRQRRREMLHEAEGEHLARRLRATRPKKAAGSGARSLVAFMAGLWKTPAVREAGIRDVHASPRRPCPPMAETVGTNATKGPS